MLREALVFGRCVILSAMTIATEISPTLAAEKLDLRQLPPERLGNKLNLEAAGTTAVSDILGPIAGLTPDDKFLLERRSQTPTAFTQFHLNQIFKNVPIWGERVIL